jgi:hypothetical protein
MSSWMTVVWLIAAVLMIWLIFRMVRGNPQAFSRENLSKSVYTIGILTVILMAVIFLCVLLLRNTI